MGRTGERVVGSIDSPSSPRRDGRYSIGAISFSWKRLSDGWKISIGIPRFCEG